jgi:hypothetical protein
MKEYVCKFYEINKKFRMDDALIFLVEVKSGVLVSMVKYQFWESLK